MTTLAGFSPVAAALADPAREAMIAALVGGCALPAGELAMAAGLSMSSSLSEGICFRMCGMSMMPSTLTYATWIPRGPRSRAND